MLDVLLDENNRGHSIPADGKLDHAEHITRLLTEYYSAKSRVLTVFAVLRQVTIIFCSIVYPGTGQPWVLWRFALFNLISVLVAMIAQSVGILFGKLVTENLLLLVFSNLPS